MQVCTTATEYIKNRIKLNQNTDEETKMSYVAKTRKKTGITLFVRISKVPVVKQYHRSKSVESVVILNISKAVIWL